MRRLLILALLLGAAAAEESAPAPAPAPPLSTAWLKPLAWRSIGPAAMGGRITGIAVSARDAATWWVATASGGLVKTTNNGITFEHQFDHEHTVSVGDVAVAPSDDRIVWVGTGEANPRNSVSWGDGVYKSTDGGKTWAHMGLPGSFQVGAIRIHPTNPDIVWVGALGHLWGPNAERGLFRTTDGGKTWQKVLYVDDRTGVIDVALNPSDPDTLLVATWERRRDGFDTNDPVQRHGPGSALFKSTDGGASFRRITAGLPTKALGRIGLDYSAKNPEVVYMVLDSEVTGTEPPDAPFLGVNGTDADAGARLTAVVADGPAAKAGLQKGDIVVRLGDASILCWADLVRLARQHVAGETVKIEVSREHKSVVTDLTLGTRPEEKRKEDGGVYAGVRPGPGMFDAGLGGQRPNLQDQQGRAGHEYGGLYRSEDGGDTWTRVNTLNPRPMYFSKVRVDPSDDRRVWVLGIRLWRSEDGGATFQGDGAPGVHPDHHALWIDPARGSHMILGTDGGIYVTWDGGKAWDHLNHVAIGQFYDAAVAPNRDYWVYGGLQDNGSWGGPNRVGHARGPTNADWIMIGGGDGFRCRVDAHDPALVYFESQGGGIGRRHLATGEMAFMQPKAPKGVRYRFNWNTPFLLSHHNAKLYYTAGNVVFRSLDRGEGLRAISPEITRTEKGSATALAESPLDPDALWVGTDDGALFGTRDGGHTWTDLWPLEAPAAPAVKAPAPANPEPVAPAAKEQGAVETEPVSRAARTETPPAQPVSAGQPLRALVPGPRWVSWIEPSRYAAGRAYVVLDAHRSDDFTPYLLVTEDYGATWRSIRGDLPDEAGTTRVLREDIANENMLWLGTEFGAWVSLDRGATWISLNTNLPTVAVHHFALQAASGDVVAATHGRSLWVLDATLLRQLTPDVLAEDVHLFTPRPAVQWRPEPRSGGDRTFTGENPYGGAEIFYALAKKAGPLTLEVTTLDGQPVRTLQTKGEAGLHRATWDLRRAPEKGHRRAPRVRPGTYRLVLETAGRTWTTDVVVENDPSQADDRWIAYADEAEELAAERDGEED